MDPLMLDEARALLREVFGHADFRGGQKTAVEAALEGRDTVVVLPTGGGKSLCYQLPALVRHRRGEGPTVVVSPLIALMDDQVRQLREREVPVVALHSGLSTEARRAAKEQAKQAVLIYCSPERLALKTTRRWLAGLGVSALAIDEAHCISEWGHDFRKDYGKLGELRELWQVPVLALTATATPSVVRDIEQSLGLDDPIHVRGGFHRDNLSFAIEHHRGDKVRVERAIERMNELGLGRRTSSGRAVVYASTRKRVVSIAKRFREAGFSVAHYHAGRTDGARRTAQERFESGKARVLVGTTAFGMGIDLPDIRLVCHVNTPHTLESYVQQAGRAGRDGALAHALLLYAPGDAMTRKRVVKRPTPGQQAGWKAMQDHVFSGRCRQVSIGTWFGVPGDRCGLCDACTDPDAVDLSVQRARDANTERKTQGQKKRAADRSVSLSTDDDDLVVQFVSHLKKPVGKRLVALGLRGSRSKPVKRARLEDNPVYGWLKHIPEASLIVGVERLLDEGRLARRGQKYPTVWIPEKRVRPKTAPGTRKRPTLPPLHRALKNLRQREARRRRWKPYMVYADATLLAILEARPSTLAELARVRGMGEKRIAKFGDAILALIAEHPDGG